MSVLEGSSEKQQSLCLDQGLERGWWQRAGRCSKAQMVTAGRGAVAVVTVEEDLEFGKDYNYMQQWSTCEVHWGQYLGLFSPQASQQSANTAAKQFPMCLHHA